MEENERKRTGETLSEALVSLSLSILCMCVLLLAGRVRAGVECVRGVREQQHTLLIKDPVRWKHRKNRESRSTGERERVDAPGMGASCSTEGGVNIYRR